MRLLTVFLLCLLLAGCGAQNTPAPETSAPAKPPAEEAVSQELLLPVGAALPLPVTEESIQAWYAGFNNFYRQVTDIKPVHGGYLVRSVKLPETEREHGTRFDWIYSDTGNCYPLLEGPYAMDEVGFVSERGITLQTTDSFDGAPVTVQAYLPRSTVDSGSLQTEELHSAAVVVEVPATLELAKDLPMTVGQAGTAQPLAGIFTGTNQLELLFHTEHNARIPEAELAYDEEANTLTLLCRDTTLECTAPAGNLYIQSIQAEQQGEDALITCSLAERANSIQTEINFLPGYDWEMGVLRLTFWPFMG